jgi:hypothetical protein
VRRQRKKECNLSCFQGPILQNLLFVQIFMSQILVQQLRTKFHTWLTGNFLTTTGKIPKLNCANNHINKIVNPD